ncbi:HAD domain-containing protein [Streptomyces sp. NBC_01426]|uniref:HAD domain-containing protein n=1 Tax=Streptomyces sp. NBC_01426 TaxID=2975866 RepID=UPI002E365CF8|nr:HAD domain-containing protein [Streptomyces sp. NBC_01426]
MTGSTRRALLFLDVDGPLIPFGGTGHREGPAQQGNEGDSGGNPLLARLDPALGARLTALRCDLVWATTWMDDANEYVAPRIGLPDLPVVAWPDPAEEDERAGLHWKTRTLMRWAAGRPFLWVDDEITPADRAWVAAHHPAPTLLHRVDPRTGLTDRDFAALARWVHDHP